MPEEQRVIFHCDCNSFYASVELLRYPELRGVPVAVCGSPDDRHGIVLAKNEPAKRYGVQTAETVWSALRKCPGLKLLPPHHGQYREMSRAVNAIYARYTDRIEPFGIDSWLDMTQTWRLFGSSPPACRRRPPGREGRDRPHHLGGRQLQQRYLPSWGRIISRTL
ncbi:MAG: hypothetical protein ACLRRT_04495 [Ruthenibacterium lactatiformans]